MGMFIDGKWLVQDVNPEMKQVNLSVCQQRFDMSLVKMGYFYQRQIGII